MSDTFATIHQQAVVVIQHALEMVTCAHEGTPFSQIEANATACEQAIDNIRTAIAIDGEEQG